MTTHNAELRPASVDMYIMCLEHIPYPITLSPAPIRLPSVIMSHCVHTTQ